MPLSGRVRGGRAGRSDTRTRSSGPGVTAFPDIQLRPLAGFIRRACLPAGLLLSTGTAFAGPQGGQVVGGQGSITTPDVNTTLINQQSHRLAIDWSSFNIAQHELVQFTQPSVTASALNQIFDQNASQIFGSLRANGEVILVNPNGVFFSPTARLSVASLIASGLNIATDDFMAGHYTFTAPVDSEGGLVVNQGLIEAATGGSVSLIGGAVRNEGVILATAGQVTLAAGRRMTVDFDGDGLIRFAISESILENAHFLDEAVSNSGEINADGGAVLLKGKAAQDVFTNVVNNEGVISAGRIENQGGVIKLVASGEGNSLINTGTLDASGDDGDGGQIKIYATGTAIVAGESFLDATSADAQGGSIQVLGDRVGLFDHATLDASGTTGGGTVLVGGDFQGKNPDVPNASRTYVGPDTSIYADATRDGDGGTVIIWADDQTRFHGTVTARGGPEGGDGGFAEISGKNRLEYRGSVNLSAPQGDTGWLLLDPESITIEGGAGNATFAGNATNGTIAFEDALSTVFESEIEGTDANILLQANVGISANGTFDNNSANPGDLANGVLALKPGRSLTLETKNDDTAGGIDLTSSVHGDDLQIVTSNGGAITITAGTNGAAGAEAKLPILKTLANAAGSGDITVTASGDIFANNTISTGDHSPASGNDARTGNITLTANPGGSFAGNLTISSALSTGNATATGTANATSGAITLTAANGAIPLTVALATGDATTASGDASSGAITLDASGAVTGDGNATLSTGLANVSGSSGDAASGNISVTAANVDFAAALTTGEA
ncbi:MAG: filamentous hemagglutinin N-terminal domain-containing protein, partial [Gammaproteobacteria bacterium]|nr:filamentous hemagglutinin N-terminal domain-containing protein [Gammaproteobacteria bacterium]